MPAIRAVVRGDGVVSDGGGKRGLVGAVDDEEEGGDFSEVGELERKDRVPLKNEVVDGVMELLGARETVV
jgi:hypothetical protein